MDDVMTGHQHSHHDLGGQPTGPIDRGEYETAFWEKRVDAILTLLTHKDREIMRVPPLDHLITNPRRLTNYNEQRHATTIDSRPYMPSSCCGLLCITVVFCYRVHHKCTTAEESIYKADIAASYCSPRHDHLDLSLAIVDENSMLSLHETR